MDTLSGWQKHKFTNESIATCFQVGSFKYSEAGRERQRISHGCRGGELMMQTARVCSSQFCATLKHCLILSVSDFTCHVLELMYRIRMGCRGAGMVIFLPARQHPGQPKRGWRVKPQVAIRSGCDVGKSGGRIRSGRVVEWASCSTLLASSCFIC